MGVRKCPKCGSVWYTALVNCAFCGVEGDEVKGPISPSRLNLGKGGVATGPPPSERDAPASSELREEAAPVPKAEVPDPPAAPAPKEAEPAPEPVPVKVEAPPAPLPPPPPQEIAPPRPERTHAPVSAPRLSARTEAPAPAPLIPSSTVPLVFGVLGLAACVVLPMIGLVRHDRVQVILGLIAWAILAPFAPSAWCTAQRYADRCRALGFSPAPAADTGRVLGTLASFVIVFEFSALAIFVVVQALSGKLVCPLWK